MSKLSKRIKEQIKSQPKKVKEVPRDIFNKLASFCIMNDYHLKTIYKLCCIKHVDQMLTTMFDVTIKEYDLHEKTVKSIIEDKTLRQEINKLLKGTKLSIPVL